MRIGTKVITSTGVEGIVRAVSRTRKQEVFTPPHKDLNYMLGFMVHVSRPGYTDDIYGEVEYLCKVENKLGSSRYIWSSNLEVV